MYPLPNALYLFLKKLPFTQLIKLYEIRKKVNDANNRFYKTVQKCEVCSYKLSPESSSYFFLWARICARYPYGVLWKGWKERVDNGRGRKFGDEPSIASEKRVCVILDILGKNHYLLFLLYVAILPCTFFVTSSLYFRMTLTSLRGFCKICHFVATTYMYQQMFAMFTITTMLNSPHLYFW